MIKKILPLIMLFLTLGLLSAEAQCAHNRKGHKGLNMTEIREKRAEYFTKKLDLTEAEAQVFIPILNEYMAEKYKDFKDYRATSKLVETDGQLTSEDYNKSIDLYLAYKQKRVDTEKRFFEKSRKVLPAQKLYKYKSIEHRFSHKVMDERNSSRGERGE